MRSRLMDTVSESSQAILGNGVRTGFRRITTSWRLARTQWVPGVVQRVRCAEDRTCATRHIATATASLRAHRTRRIALRLTSGSAAFGMRFEPVAEILGSGL